MLKTYIPNKLSIFQAITAEPDSDDESQFSQVQESILFIEVATNNYYCQWILLSTPNSEERFFTSFSQEKSPSTYQSISTNVTRETQ